CWQFAALGDESSLARGQAPHVVTSVGSGAKVRHSFAAGVRCPAGADVRGGRSASNAAAECNLVDQGGVCRERLVGEGLAPNLGVLGLQLQALDPSGEIGKVDGFAVFAE